MATSVFECEICSEDFDSGDHKPLFLLCGHTYCRLCVTRIPKKDGSRKCPRCRRLVSRPVDFLPVNYSLIPSENMLLLESQRSFTGARCNVHKAALDHFCTECDDGRIICKMCAGENHALHKVVLMNDVISKTNLEAEFTNELHGKIEASLEHFTKSLSVSSKARNLIKQIYQFDEDLQGWEENLLVGITSATQDLNAWKSAGTKALDEKQEVFQKLCRRWRGNETFTPDNLLVPNLRIKLEELNLSADLIEELADKTVAPTTESASRRTPRLPEEVLKIVGGSQVEAALNRVRLGLQPNKIIVVSSPNDPITELPNCLDLVGQTCVGNLEVKLLDEMWAPTSTCAGRLQNFIEKHGHKVSAFYGSAADAAAIACARGSSTIALGVRLESTADVRLCAELSTSPRCVSCIWGLDVRPLGNMRQLVGQPRGWHFPDLQDGDVDWLSALADLPLTLDRRCMQLYLYLPRCQLLEDDLRRLLKKSSGCVVYCEPIALPDKAQSRLADFALQRGVTLEWAMPPYHVF